MAFLGFFPSILVNWTGLINLKASKSHKNKFEKGLIDEFIVEAVDLGELQKLRIGHDSSGERSLNVTETTSECDRGLSDSWVCSYKAACKQLARY